MVLHHVELLGVGDGREIVAGGTALVASDGADGDEPVRVVLADYAGCFVDPVAEQPSTAGQALASFEGALVVGAGRGLGFADQLPHRDRR